MTDTVTLSTAGITAADVLAVARRGARVELDPAAREQVASVRAHIDALAAGELSLIHISEPTRPY